MRFGIFVRVACTAILAAAFAGIGWAKANTSSYPKISSHADALDRFVPAGWRLWDVQKGDINRDGLSDAVLILERGDSVAYRLIIVFHNAAGGFDHVSHNDEILTGETRSATESGPGTSTYPVSGGLKIRRGAFTIQMAKEDSRYETAAFTFRHQDRGFVLIGYDSFKEYRGWSKFSFNMLTGKIVWTVGSTYAGAQHVVEGTSEGQFPIQTPPPALDSIGRAFNFDGSFRGYKYLPKNPSR